jgi:hypothetical protein
MRESWAEKMSEIIVPGGMLVENCFPIYPTLDKSEPLTKVSDPPGSGPPYRLSTAFVENLLSPHFDLVETRLVPKERRGRLYTKDLGDAIETSEVFMMFRRRGKD